MAQERFSASCDIKIYFKNQKGKIMGGETKKMEIMEICWNPFRSHFLNLDVSAAAPSTPFNLLFFHNSLTTTSATKISTKNKYVQITTTFLYLFHNNKQNLENTKAIYKAFSSSQRIS